MRYLILIISLITSIYMNGQDDGMLERSFLVIKTTTDFPEAKTLAIEASKELNYSFEEKSDCWLDEEFGFDCEWMCGCGEPHFGYVPRGRADGNYVSVEHTNGYEKMESGFFVVIVSNGNKEDLMSLLPSIRTKYPDAYIKQADVYVGCTH